MEWNLLKKFFVFLLPYRFQEALLLVLILLGSLTSLASPYFLKIIIDQIIPNKDYQWLLYILVILFGIYLLRVVVGLITEYLQTWLSNKLINDIKLRLFQNLMLMPMTYFDQHKPGEIIHNVNIEVGKIQHFLTSSIIRFFNNLITLLGLITMLCILNYQLFLVAIVVIPFAIFLNRYLGGKIRLVVDKMSEKEGEVNNFFIDRVSNVPLVKSFNSYNHEFNYFNSHLTQLFNLYLKGAIYGSLAKGGTGFFVAIGPLIVFAVGGYQAIQGTMTIGALVAFIQYLNRVFAPSRDLMNLFIDFEKAKVSMKRVLPILSAERPAFKASALEQFPYPISSIEFKTVTFRYSDELVLNRLNLKLEKGKQYAVVGASGSGKSTLAKLMVRFYEPSDGQILINETTALSAINPYTWMEKVSLLSQSPLVLHESIRANLNYGNFNASESQLWQVLAAVQMDELIQKLPQGIDTLIGDGPESINPSGGQQQQLGLARILLKGGDIILLDEATSAIDSLKERKILDHITAQFKDKILLSVSHRLSSIRDFDHIIYLENGQVKEQGTHEELLKLGGGYFHLFEDQLHQEMAMH